MGDSTAGAVVVWQNFPQVKSKSVVKRLRKNWLPGARVEPGTGTINNSFVLGWNQLAEDKF